MAARPKDGEEVSIEQVVNLFVQNYRRLRRHPNEADCFRLKNGINIVRCSPNARVLNDVPGYAKRLAAHNAMSKLAKKRVAEMTKAAGGLRLPNLLELEALVEILALSRNAFLGLDAMAGTRAGAEWHKPARYLAEFAMHALEHVGRKASFEKGGPFVGVIADALDLAGQGRREPEAISEVLKSGPTLQNWVGINVSRHLVGFLEEQPRRDPSAPTKSKKLPGKG